MLDKTTKNELIASSKRLHKAFIVLRRKYTNREVRKKLNDQLVKEISEGNLSKLKNAYYNKEYLPDISLRSFDKIFDIIDPIIKKEFGKAWDGEDYKGHLDGHSPRVNGLIGVWEGYSWDSITSSNTGNSHIHIFKLHIISPDNILCKTQKATLKADKIALVENRIIIELSNPHRKIFMISNIGLADEESLMKESLLYLSYVDTGDRKVKAGLAALRRSNKSFDEIIPESKEVSYIQEPHLIEFLKNSQLIIK